MSILAGVFLIAHGLIHLAIWLSPPSPNAPFDPRRSWLIGDAAALFRVLAAATCVFLLVAGILVLAGAGLGSGLAVIGAALSLVLVVLTFHLWLSAAIAIDVAIIVIAIS